MSTITVNETLNNVLQEFAFKDVTEVIKDYLITEILCKISDFSQEVEHFQEKYGQNLGEFTKVYEAGEEDFVKYDDLMAWKFAQQGKEYWEKQLKGVRDVL